MVKVDKAVKSDDAHGFNYFYDSEINAGDVIILKMPMVTPNKRGINDIGVVYSGDIAVYGTLSKDYDDDNSIWQQIQPRDDVNKTVSYLKFINNGEVTGRINVRIILN